MKKVTIYTDGSCSKNPGPGGYGAILMCDGAEKEISGGAYETTNNRMELQGPIEALKLLKEPCEVEMYSDSAYVVNSFEKGWIYSWARNGWTKKDGPLKNVDLLQELYGLCKTHQVTGHKVKGHADNAYNNRCDRLAVAETEKHRQQPREISRDEAYDGPLAETVQDTETVFQGRVFSVEKLKVTLPDGRTSFREVVRHNGGAAIVAVDGEQNVYMVRQFRIAAGREMLEIPAGKIEPGEDPAVCAARELTEETGLKAGRIEHLVSMYATPGYCGEKLHIYLAADLSVGNPHRDPGEFLNVCSYPLRELLDMVYSGKLEDAKTVTGLLLAAQRILK